MFRRPTPALSYQDRAALYFVAKVPQHARGCHPLWPTKTRRTPAPSKVSRAKYFARKRPFHRSHNPHAPSFKNSHHDDRAWHFIGTLCNSAGQPSPSLIASTRHPPCPHKDTPCTAPHSPALGFLNACRQLIGVASCLCLLWRWLLYSGSGGWCWQSRRLWLLPLEQSLDPDLALLHVPHRLGQTVQFFLRLESATNQVVSNSHGEHKQQQADSRAVNLKHTKNTETLVIP